MAGLADPSYCRRTPVLAARRPGNPVQRIIAIKRFDLILRAFRNPNYAVYVAGNSVSLIGTWMQRIGVGWLTWELTESEAWLGVIAFADLFPSVFIGPIGGAVADRFSRVRIILIAQMTAMVLAFALFAFTASGTMDIWLLLFLVFANGIVLGFNQPSRLALIPSLVPREDLSTAVAINSIIFNLARFVGPAIAGALIVSGGTASVFLANGLTYTAFLLALTRLRLPPDPPRPRAPGRGMGARAMALVGDVREGIAFTARHPGIGPILLLLAINSMTVRPFVELLPGFAATVYGRGADGLALMVSTIGVGAILGGLWLAGRPGMRGLTMVTLASILGLAVAILGFVATDVFAVGLVSLAFAGIALVLSGVGTQTLVQLSVYETMRGRVLSLYGIIFRGGPAAGALVIGLVAELIGLRLATAIGAVASLGVWVWAWLRRERMRESLEEGGEAAGGAPHPGVRP